MSCIFEGISNSKLLAYISTLDAKNREYVMKIVGNTIFITTNQMLAFAGRGSASLGKST